MHVRTDPLAPLKERRPPLSSYVGHLALGVALFVSAAALASSMSTSRPSAHEAAPIPLSAPPAPQTGDIAIAESLAQWEALRRSDSLPFESYAAFLIAHPGWPEEIRLRRLAESKADEASASPRLVADLFARFPPQSANGHARHAEALARLGRKAEAQAAARMAWGAGTLSPADEARLLGRFAADLTPADHDRRLESLLARRNARAAQLHLPRLDPDRREMAEARIAFQLLAPDAATRAAALDSAALGDPGYLLDHARWLAATTGAPAARELLSRPHALNRLPVDPALWVDTLLGHAREASAQGQHGLAVALARNADLAFPSGTEISRLPFAIRDDYTSLAWIGGQAALKRLGRPAQAIALFDRYAAAAQTLQTKTKGWYWAGRAALAARDEAGAKAWFARAAAYPDQFYGQLAAERIGAAPIPPALVSHPTPSTAERTAFERKPLVRAARQLGQRGQWKDQSLFLRAIARDVESETEAALAAELSRTLGRPDLGVMVARNRRNAAGAEIIRAGFPAVDVTIATPRLWTIVHAIARQESQFDKQIVSHAGAMGLMQLMPGTARETAGKLGLPYDSARLTTDPSYNAMLGSSFFARLLDSYGGNHVLAVAAYNAGPGNVRKWLAANGDPRDPNVDIIDWIEAIPFSETRGYVQRVLENAVVYDAINPAGATMEGSNRLSAWLGKPYPG